MTDPYYADDAVTLYAGDCLDVLPTLPDASVDAVVTDPPYGLEFMGKEWDAFKPANAKVRTRVDARTNGAAKSVVSVPEAYIAGHPFQTWCQLWAAECLRVLKPGGHLLAFGGTRTWHRLAVAIEDAGFEIRDSIAWLYGSGFPKSLDVSKAIDKAAGAEREVVGRYTPPSGQAWNLRNDLAPTGYKDDLGARSASMDITAPATADAQRWQGWGTALKPAHEPVVVARKPLVGTVAANVLAHGTGALNIDGCRLSPLTADEVARSGKSTNGAVYGDLQPVDWKSEGKPHPGRWPANVALDETAAAALDHMSGESSSPAPYVQQTSVRGEVYGLGSLNDKAGKVSTHHGDFGGASRFFYTAKAGSDERITHDGVAHPTVKPLALMRWLVRLVTPPGGLILEPFAGSGTTVEAAILEGFRCIAIEREPDYLPLITQRLNRRRDPVAYLTAAGEDLGLLDFSETAS